METLTISLKETFRKGIPNAKILNVCQFGDAEYLICTKNQVFHFSAFKDSGNNLVRLNYAFKTCIFIKDLNIICAIGSSLPNIVFFSIRSGFPLICESYRLSSSLYDTIQYSPKSRKLIVSGDTVEVFDMVVEWKLFEIDPMITLINKLSFSCGRMTSNVYLDELRQILIIPSILGISTVDLTNLSGSPNHNLNNSVSSYQLGTIPFQTMAFYNSPKISKKTSLSNIPFKSLITTNSNGDISLWNSSSIKTCHPIHNFRKLNEVSILCEFVDNEFCLFVTESKPNYFVILFDIKTGKNIKLTSFDTKVLKMSVISKNNVSFITENFYVIYQLNIPWHLFSKTASNAVAIRRYPTNAQLNVFSGSSRPKAARVATLFDDGIVSLFSPDVHFLLTEIGTTCSCRIVDFIYDRCSSLRIRDKIISIKNINEQCHFFNSTDSNSDKISNSKSETSKIIFDSNLATSKINLNSNLATSKIDNSTLVAFNFDDIKKERMTQKTDKVNNSISVNFLPQLIKLKKKEKLKRFRELGERFILLLDDGTLQIFTSENDNFTLSRTISTMNLSSIAMTYIKDEDDSNSIFPIFIGFNKDGKLLSFHFDTFEVLSRTGLSTNLSKSQPYPLFVCIHHQTNSIYAIYENEIAVIDSVLKKIIQTEPLNSRPKYASLEDNLLLIAFENRTIVIRHLNGQQASFTEESIKLLENVTFAIVQYETFIIVTDDKTVRLGQSFDHCALFEFPFKIFSAGFLNPELDLALGLDFEVMVIRRSIWYPFIKNPFECASDNSDPKSESYITTIHGKAVLYNIADEEEEADKLHEKNLSISSSSSFPSPLRASKNFSLHKSSPSLVKAKGKQNSNGLQNGQNEGEILSLNRKKKLPELRTKEEMLNDRKFQELFKDIGSSFVDSSKKIISGAAPGRHDDSYQHKNSVTDTTKTHAKIRVTDSLAGVPLNGTDNDDSHEIKKKMKKKKKVAKKSAVDQNVYKMDDQNELKNQQQSHHSPKPPQVKQSESSPRPRSIGNTKSSEARTVEAVRGTGRGDSKEEGEGRDSESLTRRQAASAARMEQSAGVSEEVAAGNGNDEIISIIESSSNGAESEANSSADDEQAGDMREPCSHAHSADTGASGDTIKGSHANNNNSDLEMHASSSCNDDAERHANSCSSGEESRAEGDIHSDVIEGMKSDTHYCNDRLLPQLSQHQSLNDEGQHQIKSTTASPGVTHNCQPLLEPTEKISVKTVNNRPPEVKKFMPLNRHTDLTSSSPDLLLLQAQLGQVKITAKPRKSDQLLAQSGTHDDLHARKELPLITVHLIQRSFTRTRSEYCLVRTVEQQPERREGYDENGFYEFQIQRLAKLRKTVELQQINNNRGFDTNRREMVSIRPLLAAKEKQNQTRKEARNMRRDFIKMKRTDRQPLGNVELSIQVFHPSTTKK